MPLVNVTEMRREFDAAKKDNNTGLFYENLRKGLKEKHLRPEDFSVRQLFEAMVPDGAEYLRLIDPRAQGGFITENISAIDTTAFSNVMGQIVYSKILDAASSTEINVFSNLVTTVPTQLNGEKLPGVSRLGDKAEVINEGSSYPTAGVNEDWIETPVTYKRGLIVPVTKEAVFFDRTNLILSRAKEVGEFLQVNKEKRIINAVIDENETTYRYKWRGTSYASYQSSTPWVNLKSSNPFVDWTSVDAAEQQMYGLTDPYTGEPISITPKHLIFCRDIKNKVMMTLSATTVRTGVPGYATSGNPSETEWANPLSGYTPVTSPLLKAQMATDTSWYIGDIGRAVYYMENWGITVTQAPNNSEQEFTNDVIARFKASERGTPVVVEPRALQKNTA